MIRTALVVSACWILVAPLAGQDTAQRAVIGRWDLTITTGDGRPLPSWLEVELSGNRTLIGRYVGVVGSARPISRLNFSHDTLRFSIPPQWESGDNDLQVEGVLARDTLSGWLVEPDGDRMSWSGVRAPVLRRPGNPQWSPSLKLFNGADLNGWHAVGGGENAWKVVGGVLTNAKAGANLVTDAVFTDFKLHVEFRYPAKGNSGIYLRGRYEVQIEDTTGHALSHGSIGAIYGFLPSNQNAAKGAGEWQSYDITLIGRLVTVVLNGRQVISQQEIPGITGGALDSREGAAGPIMLQGDHGPVEYRSIVLTPAR